jgi:YD repeat-containing protein
VWKDVPNTGLVEFAYTRYEYPTNGIQSKVYSTVTDTDNNGVGNTVDEILTESWTDGAGRVRLTRTPMSWDSNGDTATWSGQRTEYDILGQVKRQSVPTEVDSDWDFAVSDSTRTDWLWTHTKYDWKGRVVRIIDTDGIDSSTLNDSDQLISYDGCGCAGGQVTTIQGARVPVPGQTNTYARRTQKIHEDILGRTYKVENMKWNGTDVYSKVVHTLNGRGQIIISREYDIDNNLYQDTTFTYDGYGRLASQHLPEQDSNTATVYNYNDDNSIESITDSRGATTNYDYNYHGQVSSISYSVPQNSNIQVPSTITFGYDAAGNRVSMIDGLGRIDYEYNQLSQLMAETRRFTDNLPNAPLDSNNNQAFRLEYTYALSGQLQSYKDPYQKQINYTQDKVGRLTAVTGTSFAGFTTYASNPQYRAWGVLKHLEFSNGVQMNLTYNNRLLADTYELTRNGFPNIMQKEYQYYPDGNFKFVEDELNTKFDRLNLYDNLGQIQEAKSAIEASGGTVTTNLDQNLPYRQSYGFDAFGNMTQRNNLHWGATSYAQMSFNLSYTYQNNRVTNQDWQHDADGRVTVSAPPDRTNYSYYDAAGQLIRYRKSAVFPSPVSEVARFYDGDGREAKRIDRGDCPSPQNPCNEDLEVKYFIRSSVLDKEVISEVASDGKKKKTFVMAAGAIIAWQSVSTVQGNPSEALYFEHWDASGMSQRTTFSTGGPLTLEDADGAPVELDGFGNNVGISNPYNRTRPVRGDVPPSPTLNNYFGDEPYYINGQRVTSILDGMEVPYGTLVRMGRAGALQVELRNSQGQVESVENVEENLGTLRFVNRIGLQGKHYPKENKTLWSVSSVSSTWFIPQKQSQTRVDNSYDLPKLLDDAQKIIEDQDISKECKDLIGEKNLAKFKEKKSQFFKDPDNNHVPSGVAARTYDSGNVYINPWTSEWNPDYQTLKPEPDKKASKPYKKSIEKYNDGVKKYQKTLKELGVNSYQYAVAGIIHEFLHQIGVFEPDSDGNESLENQKKVIDACLKNTKIELTPKEKQ